MSGFVAILQTNGAAIGSHLLQDSLNLAPFDVAQAQMWAAEGIGLCAAPLDSPHDEVRYSFAHHDRLAIVMDGRLDDRMTLIRALDTELGRPFTGAADVELVLG